MQTVLPSRGRGLPSRGQRPLGGACPAGGLSPPAADGAFGKLVIGNVLRGRRPCAGGGQKPRGERG